MIDIWRVPLETAPAGAGLALEERQRADRMLDSQARSRFLASRTWLRVILAGYVGVDPTLVRFATSERGKPALADGGDLHFSLSRSGGVAVVAVGRGQPLGVDVEQVRDDVDHAGVAHRFFAPAEADWLRERPDDERRDAFFWLWVRKEAVVKASGAGLGGGVSHVDVRDDTVDGRWSLASLDVGPGLAAAVAVAGPVGPVTVLAPDDLPAAAVRG